jgi:sec-independent protein translocase protein TatA
VRPGYNRFVACFAFIGGLGPAEMVIVLVIGLLLFGSRLPEVGRSLGKSLAQFKRGLKGIETEMEEVERQADRELDEEERTRRALPASPARDEERQRSGSDVS